MMKKLSSLAVAVSLGFVTVASTGCFVRSRGNGHHHHGGRARSAPPPRGPTIIVRP